LSRPTGTKWKCWQGKKSCYSFADCGGRESTNSNPGYPHPDILFHNYQMARATKGARATGSATETQIQHEFGKGFGLGPIKKGDAFAPPFPALRTLN
jgi:hypothetical protein